MPDADGNPTEREWLEGLRPEDRLFDAPVDPDTLTDRQRAALANVGSYGLTGIRAVELGQIMHGHWNEREHWHFCGYCKQAGLSVLRELHRKGLVRRVGRGGGRWALVGEDAQSASEVAAGAADSSSPTSAQGDFPEGF